MFADEERTGLRVLAADEDERALRETTELLRELGHEVTDVAVDVATAVERIAADEPDLAVVVVHQDDEHALALIEELNEYATGPVIALLHGDDPAFAPAPPSAASRRTPGSRPRRRSRARSTSRWRATPRSATCTSRSSASRARSSAGP